MTPTNAKSRIILIVDDIPDNLTILTTMLTQRGYLVRPALNGPIALKSLQKDIPDLILLDIMMPLMSGYEVCQALKANERTRDIPVIFISALHEVFDKVKGFEAGGVDYITKPFQPQEVLARVETHLTIRQLHKELQEKNARIEAEINEHLRAEDALRESMAQIEQAKQEWEATADALSYLVCLIDKQGRVIRANRTVEYWNLGQVGEVSGCGLHVLLHPNCQDPACYLDAFLAQAWEEIAQGIAIGYEARDRLLRRCLSIQVRPISPKIGRETRLAESFAVAVISDITERKRAEESLQQRNAELLALNRMSDEFQACHTEAETYAVVAETCQALFPADAGVLYITDAARTSLTLAAAWNAPAPAPPVLCVDACLSFGRQKMYLVEEPADEPLCGHLDAFPQHGYVCVPIRTPEQILGILHLAFGSGGADFFEEESRRQHNAKQIVVTRVTEHYALVLTNLRLRETLRLEAIRDPLTGLYNRRYMEESLEREAQRTRRRGTSMGIIMVDIDHFKQLNDTHGHEAGDVVLRELGALFRRHTRSEDTACRYGGEEFLLIMPEVQLEIARQRAEELRVIVADCLRIRWREQTLSVTISIGVAALPAHGFSITEVLKAADDALYQAKANGRNQVSVSSIQQA